MEKILFLFKIKLLILKQDISLMNDDNYLSDNKKKDEINIHDEECEYKHLFTKLSEISSTIALLEKKYIDKL